MIFAFGGLCLGCYALGYVVGRIHRAELRRSSTPPRPAQVRRRRGR